MPKKVVFASGYDSETRPHSSEKFRRRRILASVMANLKHIGTDCLCIILGQNFTFHLFFGVSREQERFASVVYPEDKRIVVLCGSGKLLGNALRPQKVSVCAVPVKRLAAKGVFDGDISLTCKFFQLRAGMDTSRPIQSFATRKFSRIAVNPPK